MLLVASVTTSVELTATVTVIIKARVNRGTGTMRLHGQSATDLGRMTDRPFACPTSVGTPPRGVRREVVAEALGGVTRSIGNGTPRRRSPSAV